jgi:hypothetical protein
MYVFMVFNDMFFLFFFIIIFFFVQLMLLLFSLDIWIEWPLYERAQFAGLGGPRANTQATR